MNILLNGNPHEFAPPLSIAGLLLALKLAGRLAVERNGEIVPRSQHPTVFLEAGDRLEIVAAIGGG